MIFSCRQAVFYPVMSPENSTGASSRASPPVTGIKKSGAGFPENSSPAKKLDRMKNNPHLKFSVNSDYRLQII